MRTMLTVFVGAAMTVVLAACGGSDSTTETEVEVTTTYEEAAETVTETAEEAAEDASSAAEELMDDAAKAMEMAREKAKELAESGSELAEDAKDALVDAAAAAQEKAEELMEDAAALISGDDLHAQLIDTQWQVGDFTFHFLDESTVKVKGGPLATLAPNGLDAQYTFEDGEIEVTAMNQTKTGTWDGETMIVDGTEAVRLSAGS